MMIFPNEVRRASEMFMLKKLAFHSRTDLQMIVLRDSATTIGEKPVRGGGQAFLAINYC